MTMMVESMTARGGVRGIDELPDSAAAMARCRYKTGRCPNPRVVKPNGKRLLLCEFHRHQQNCTKKRSDLKYRHDRARKRQALKTTSTPMSLSSPSSLQGSPSLSPSSPYYLSQPGKTTLLTKLRLATFMDHSISPSKMRTRSFLHSLTTANHSRGTLVNSTASSLPKALHLSTFNGANDQLRVPSPLRFHASPRPSADTLPFEFPSGGHHRERSRRILTPRRVLSLQSPVFSAPCLSPLQHPTSARGRGYGHWPQPDDVRLLEYFIL